MAEYDEDQGEEGGEQCDAHAHFYFFHYCTFLPYAPFCAILFPARGFFPNARAKNRPLPLKATLRGEMLVLSVTKDSYRTKGIGPGAYESKISVKKLEVLVFL